MKRGFTLVELSVSLAILGLVSSTVYLALGGTLTSVERVREAQEPYQKGRVVRAFLATALHSAAPFAGDAEDGFVAVDSARAGLPRDELTFVAFAPGSRGLRMQVHLYVADSAGTPVLKLGVRELSAKPHSLPPYRVHELSRGVAGLEIEYLAAPAADRISWQKKWESMIRLPHAVRIHFVPAEAADPAYRIPLLIQIPAGRLL
jgi:prepilin-type N-terminal cleavage/methylation domain-containing protein